MFAKCTRLACLLSFESLFYFWGDCYNHIGCNRTFFHLRHENVSYDPTIVLHRQFQTHTNHISGFVFHVWDACEQPFSVSSSTFLFESHNCHKQLFPPHACRAHECEGCFVRIFSITLRTVVSYHAMLDSMMSVEILFRIVFHSTLVTFEFCHFFPQNTITCMYLRYLYFEHRFWTKKKNSNISITLDVVWSNGHQIASLELSYCHIALYYWHYQLSVSIGLVSSSEA